MAAARMFSLARRDVFISPSNCSPLLYFSRHLRGTSAEDRYPYKKSEMQRFLADIPGFNLEKKIGHVGRHPGELPRLADVLKKLDAKDSELDKPINIGLPSNYSSERKEEDNIREERRARLKMLKEQKYDEKLEKLSRLRQLSVPLEEVKVAWKKTLGPVHIKEIAEHYGIYRDLFDGAHFFPRVPLDIYYDYGEEADEVLTTPVYRGNHVKPSEAKNAPHVHFEADEGSFWTLVLTNPDGHLQDNSSEYLHWFIGNIPGNAVEKGEVVCDYLQPFPPKGTGFHRLIFVLYKQEGRIDYDKHQRPSPCLLLKDRTFKTLDFYMEQQDQLTPAGLAFFQCDWDETIQDFFHNVLKMREPTFEYDHPPAYIKPQEITPFKQPFNIYLDKYRDPQDIGKEILLKRLKTVHPFEEAPKPKFPNLKPIPPGTPEWLKTEMFKERLRIGKYRGLDVQIFKPERYRRPMLGIFDKKKREAIKNHII